MSNGPIAPLVAGGLLCVAPALSQFNVKLPGAEVSAGLKATVYEQGAELKREIADLQQKFEGLSKKGITPAVSAEAVKEKENNNKIVLIAYDAPRRDQAKRMEKLLLDSGFAANAVYTEFQEITKLPAGSTTLVYTRGQKDTALKMQQDLLKKVPELASVQPSEASTLSAGDIQYRLF